MTISIPPEIERSILAAVQSRRFRSVDEAVATAWLEWSQKQADAIPAQAEDADASPDPLLGLWRDYADEMDEIVADAYRLRREEAWRELEPSAQVQSRTRPARRREIVIKEIVDHERRHE
jgi:Arc/MetJ-type ribon-helix-helix transcriptional regulator